MSLAKILQTRWGVRTFAAQKTVSVGTTPLEVIPNNPDRLGVLIINMSTNTLYLALDNTVSSSKGMILAPSGGSISLCVEEDFQLVGWALWGLASGASSTLYVVEVVEY